MLGEDGPRTGRWRLEEEIDTICRNSCVSVKHWITQAMLESGDAESKSSALELGLFALLVSREPHETAEMTSLNFRFSVLAPTRILIHTHLEITTPRSVQYGGFTPDIQCALRRQCVD